jgi:hypothetical protein
MPPVIDKVDVYIPEGTPPGAFLTPVFAELRHSPHPAFRASRFYKYLADLRKQFEIDAVVHLFYRHGKEGHKIEIIDAGKKTIWEMAEIISQLFEVDPCDLRLMRVDLAADVEGVPVPWFREHALINRKQFSSRFEKSIDSEVEFVAMGTARAQTLYAGKRPNLIRIYNKLAEWFCQYKKIDRNARRFNAGLAALELTPERKQYAEIHPQSFATFCKQEGYAFQEGSILTRVEQQIGGDRFPSELCTFGDLRHAHEITPFTGLRLVGLEPILALAPAPGVSMRNHLAALGYRELQKELGGAQNARAFVYAHSNGNGKRMIESLEESHPASRAPLTVDEVCESYRKSTSLQLADYTRKGIY